MRVVECQNVADFVKLTKLVYQRDSHFMPQDERAHIQKIVDTNPNAKMLMVPDHARILVIPNQQQCLLGFFEAIDNQTAVDLLFAKVREYSQSLNLTEMIGPINHDTWHRYRFSVGPQGKPFLMEPYNPDYYPKLWENQGFNPISEYFSRHISDIKPMRDQLESTYQKVFASGFRFRCFDSKHFERDIKIIYDISCATFIDNFMYCEISFADFLKLYRPAKAMINERLIVFVENNEGVPVGFFFAIPDLFNAVKAYRSSITPFKQIQFAWHKAKVHTINCKTTAILGSYQRMGLAQALQYYVYNEALKLGYSAANLCLIHQDNVSDKINQQQGDIIRRYKLYGQPL